MKDKGNENQPNFELGIPRNAYIEIVHTSHRSVEVGWLNFNNPNIDSSAKTILQIEKLGYQVVYYEEGDPSSNLPDVPKDTPIVLGGGILILGNDEATNGCVNLRVKAYRQAGFQNVRADRRLSITSNIPPREPPKDKKNSEY
jgi:hypothetical protein